MFTSRSLAVALVLAIKVSCAAQEASVKSPVVERIPGGGSLLRVISGDRLSVTVYSAETSSFAQVKFATPLPDDLLLTAESNFVVFQVGRSVYAINAVASKWARLELSSDAPAELRMNKNFVVAFDERGMFVFGRKASAWQGINRSTGEPIEAEQSAD